MPACTSGQPNLMVAGEIDCSVIWLLIRNELDEGGHGVVSEECDPEMIAVEAGAPSPNDAMGPGNGARASWVVDLDRREIEPAAVKRPATRK